MDIEARIKHILAVQLGFLEAEIRPEHSFVYDLGANVLDMGEILMDLEDEFGIDITDEAADRIRTVQQAIDYIASVCIPTQSKEA